MKGRTWFLLVFVALVIFYVAANRRAEKRRHAEINLLHTIGTVVQLNLEAGGQLPTNWFSLTNSASWKKTIGYYEEVNSDNLRQELFFVLPRSVTNEETGGFCFLVSAKPTKLGDTFGRWTLIVGPTLQPEFPDSETTNTVRATWLPEDTLKPEIRSQLTNRIQLQ